jgi:PadR family transcriptional regulator PadR
MTPGREPYMNRVELLQGTLDMLILQRLQWGAQHGYAISQSIRAQSGDVLQVETGSLYPALHRMERQGWVVSKWGQTEQKQRAKFYRITAEGKKQLARDRSRWETMVAAIGSIMSPIPEA